MFPKIDPLRISEEPALAELLRQGALLLVDLQNDYLHPQGLLHRLGLVHNEPTYRDEFLKCTSALLQAMRAANRPVIWLRTELRPDHLDSGFSPEMSRLGLGVASGFLVEGSWGVRFIDELSPSTEDFIITKKGHSPYDFAYLDRLLANLGVATVIVVGGGVMDGVPETVRQSGMLGYEVVVPKECIAYGYLKERETSRSLASVTTSDKIIEALPEPAAGPDLRQGVAPGSALILVDIQNDFLHPEGLKGRANGDRMGEEDRQLLALNNQLIIDAAHSVGAPVVFVGTHARTDNLDRAWSKAMRRSSPIPPGEFYLPLGSWGAQFLDPLHPEPEDFVVMKRGQSGFGLTHLHRLLRNLGVDHCYVSGGAVHGCVEATIRDGVGLGYSFTLIHDAAYPPRSLNPEVLASHAQFCTTDQAAFQLRGATSATSAL